MNVKVHLTPIATQKKIETPSGIVDPIKFGRHDRRIVFLKLLFVPLFVVKLAIVFIGISVKKERLMK